VGGVIKIFDYLHHTLGIGFDRAIAWGPPLPGAEAAIREHVAYKNAIDDPRIEFRLLKDLDLDASAWVLFSEPSQHPDIEHALRGESSPRQPGLASRLSIPAAASTDYETVRHKRGRRGRRSPGEWPPAVAHDRRGSRLALFLRAVDT